MLLDDMARWFTDGHHLWLELQKSELVVTGVQCPNELDPDGGCKHPRYGCLVRHFIQIYGLECNVGVCEPAPHIEIAWSVMGDRADVDLCQVWIIPTSDPFFASFAGLLPGEEPV